MGVQMEIRQVRKRDGGVKGVMERTKSAALKVGLVAGLGEHPSADDGTTIIEVGAINEFGAGNNPERPFIRQTIARNHAEYARLRKALLAQIIAGTTDSKKAVAILGVKAQADIVQSINDWDTPPNSPETEERKGANNPLVDTGIMKKSIQWEAL